MRFVRSSLHAVTFVLPLTSMAQAKCMASETDNSLVGYRVNSCETPCPSASFFISSPGYEFCGEASQSTPAHSSSSTDSARGP